MPPLRASCLQGFGRALSGLQLPRAERRLGSRLYNTETPNTSTCGTCLTFPSPSPCVAPTHRYGCPRTPRPPPPAAGTLPCSRARRSSRDAGCSASWDRQTAASHVPDRRSRLLPAARGLGVAPSSQPWGQCLPRRRCCRGAQPPTVPDCQKPAPGPARVPSPAPQLGSCIAPRSWLLPRLLAGLLCLFSAHSGHIAEVPRARRPSPEPTFSPLTPRGALASAPALPLPNATPPTVSGRAKPHVCSGKGRRFACLPPFASTACNREPGGCQTFPLLPPGERAQPGGSVACCPGRTRSHLPSPHRPCLGHLTHRQASRRCPTSLRAFLHHWGRRRLRHLAELGGAC